jgi:hypothetical protein
LFGSVPGCRCLSLFWVRIERPGPFGRTNLNQLLLLPHGVLLHTHARPATSTAVLLGPCHVMSCHVTITGMRSPSSSTGSSTPAPISHSARPRKSLSRPAHDATWNSARQRTERMKASFTHIDTRHDTAQGQARLRPKPREKCRGQQLDCFFYSNAIMKMFCIL